MHKENLSQFFRRTFRSSAQSQLSCRALQSAILQRKGHTRQASDPRLTHNHHGDVSVTSPFYDRNKAYQKPTNRSPEHLDIIHQKRSIFTLRNQTGVKIREAHRSLHATPRGTALVQLQQCRNNESPNPGLPRPIKRQAQSQHHSLSSSNHESQKKEHNLIRSKQSNPVQNVKRPLSRSKDSRQISHRKTGKSNHHKDIKKRRLQELKETRQQLQLKEMDKQPSHPLNKSSLKIRREASRNNFNPKSQSQLSNTTRRVLFKNSMEMVSRPSSPKRSPNATSIKTIGKNQSQKGIRSQPSLKSLKKVISSSKKISALFIQNLILKVENGYELSAQDLNEFKQLPVDIMQENCRYLQENVGMIDSQVFDKIKNHLLQNYQGQQRQNLDNKNLQALKAILDKVEWSKRGSPFKKAQKFKKQSRVINNLEERDSIKKEQSIKKSCFHSEVNHYSLKDLDEILGQQKSTKQLEFLVENPSIKSTMFFNLQETEFEEAVESDQDSEQQNQQNVKQAQTRSPERLRFTAYRKFSGVCQPFKYQTNPYTENDDEQTEQSSSEIRQEIKEKMQSLTKQLDEQASLFDSKIQTLQSLTDSLNKTKIAKLIVNPTDSLLTVRRKILLIQKVLGSIEKMPPIVKQQLEKYVVVLKETKFLENRRWMEAQLRRKVVTQVENRDLLSEQDRVEQERKVVGKVAWACRAHQLNYINLKATNYQDGDMEAQYMSLDDQSLKRLKKKQKKVLTSKPSIQILGAVTSQREDPLAQKQLKHVSAGVYVF